MEEIEELMTSYPPPVFELHECVMRHEAIVVEIDEKEEALMKHLGGPHAEKAEEVTICAKYEEEISRHRSPSPQGHS